MKRFVSALLLSVLMIFSLFAPIRAQQPSAALFVDAGNLPLIHQPRGFDAKALDATFALYGYRDAGAAKQTHFLCTAFAVSRDKQAKDYRYVLLSAGHCVYNQPADVKFAVAEQIGGPLFSVTPAFARLEKSEDVSMFLFASPKKYPVLNLGDERYSSAIGDETINPNFSEGLVKQLALGRIASAAITNPVHCGYLCDGRYIVQEQAAGGASGSPIILKRTHTVIGILVVEFGGDVGFGVEPISTVRVALQKEDQFKALHQPQAEEEEDDNQ